jgi:phosphoglycerate dehydrogenase-like enzyme
MYLNVKERHGVIKKVLISDEFIDWRFHPGAKELPYEYSGHILRDELLKHEPEIDVVYSESREQTKKHLANADLILSDFMRKSDLEAAKRLKWVHMRGSGPDHYFKISEVGPDDFRRKGIAITTSAGAVSVVVAEQVLCYMTMFSRRMLHALEQQRKHLWRRYGAFELCGMTAGIIGLGAIGSRVARLCRALEMRVLATELVPLEHKEKADSVLPAKEYRSLIKEADFVVLACPITEETRLIIRPETLGLMKPTACLINVGRGELVDERAVIAALRAKKLAGYASDNFGDASGELTADNLEDLPESSELWDAPNVIITPNCAEAAGKRYVYMAENIATNIARWKLGQPLLNRLVWNGQQI